VTKENIIKAILACDEQGGIAANGGLPWPSNAKDMSWYKENTKGHVIVMGSSTWTASDFLRPMPMRTNVLVTTRPDDYPGAHEYISGDIAHQVCLIADSYPGLITWVIGGAEVISQTLDVIDEFYLSRIPGSYDCDTFLDVAAIEDQFELTFQEVHPEVTFEIWKKK